MRSSARSRRSPMTPVRVTAPDAPTPASTRRRRSCISTRAVARPATAWVRGVNASLAADGGRAVVRARRRDFHARFAATRPALHVPAAEPPRAPRRCCAAASAGTIAPLDVDAMRDGARASRRHARFLGVSRGRVPGEIAGEDAARARHRARRCARALRFHRRRVPPSHGAQHRRRARRCRRRQAQPPAWIAELLAAADRTRGPRRRLPPTACIFAAPSTMRASRCRRRAATSPRSSSEARRRAPAITGSLERSGPHEPASRSAASRASPTASRGATRAPTRSALVFWRGYAARRWHRRRRRRSSRRCRRS